MLEPKTTEDFKAILNTLEDEGVLDLKQPLRQSLPSIAARIQAAQMRASLDSQPGAEAARWWFLVSDEPPYFLAFAEF